MFFDVVVVGLVAVGFVWGLLKGLVRIVVMLGALVGAFLLASWFHRDLAERLVGFPLPAVALRVLAYLAIFAGVVIVGELVAWLLRKVVKAALLGMVDRLAGAALGVAAAFAAVAFLVLPIVAHTGGARLLGGSVLAPYVSVLSDLAAEAVPRGLAREYRLKMETLRRAWMGGNPIGVASPGSARPAPSGGR